MFSLLAFVLFVATVAMFFMPDLLKGPLQHFLLVGGILWFAISRWMKKEWDRRINAIANKHGDPYERISEIGKSQDFWQDSPRKLQQMDYFSQGDIGTAKMVFSGCSFIWIGLWPVITF
jgi:hypothetical protein